jgi:integrase
MRGNVTRRGRESWRLKFELPRGPDGKRRFQVVTVRGKRRDAEKKLSELLTAVDRGTFVEPSKVTVVEHVAARIDQWEAAGAIGGKTAERYRELLDGQISPHLGGKVMQQLKPIDIETWHTTLRTKGRKDGAGGVGAHTIRSAHRVLSKALRDAVRFDMAMRNVAGKEGQTAPRVSAEEIEIISVEKIGDVLEKLRGRAIFAKAVIALFTGIRRGELLALRWNNVDLDTKEIRIREALEETKAHGIRFKVTKTKSGRRDIELPDIVVETLREHRRAQLEQRMAMGVGRLPDDALVFPATDGGPQSPRNFSGDWREAAISIGLNSVSLHALRHTHASMLIDSNIDVVRISKRLGHASPNITLQVYAHLFASRDSKSAAAINAALAELVRRGTSK